MEERVRIVEKPSYWSSLTLIEKFVLSRWLYGQAVSVIDDFEYTLLLRAMQDNFPDSEYLARSWSSDPCPVELLNRLGLKQYVKAVILNDKTESIPTLNTWKELEDTLGTWTGYGTLSYKLDGWNIQANYYNGELMDIHTRGRSGDNKDVSCLSDRIPNTIPEMGSVKVVFELTVNKVNYAFCQREFGNASWRNAVSTVLAKPEYHDLLSIHAHTIHGVPTKNKFKLLQSWGFETADYCEIRNYEDLVDTFNYMSDEAGNYELYSDGIVFDGNGVWAIRLGFWEEPIYRTYVTGYRESYNLYRISPQVVIQPVIRKGTRQRNINVTNWQRIIDYNLCPGSPIAFRVASSAIADLDIHATQLLQEQYKDRYEEYAKMIDEEEAVRQSIEMSAYQDIKEIDYESDEYMDV